MSNQQGYPPPPNWQPQSQGQPPYPAGPGQPPYTGGSGQPPYTGGSGQPPYAGGPAPYGGYPPPPRRRSRARTALIAVLSVFGVLVLLFVGIIVLGMIVGPQDDNTAGGPTAPSTGPSATQPTPSCLGGCFQGVKTTTVLARLKTAGFVCKLDHSDYRCWKGTSNLISLTVGLDQSEIQSFYTQTFSSRIPNGNPQGRQTVVTLARANLQLMIPLVITDPKARAQVTAWFTKNLGTCPIPGPNKVGTYGLECAQPSAITIEDKIPLTSWDNTAAINSVYIP